LAVIIPDVKQKQKAEEQGLFALVRVTSNKL
jgi:hypothetical protein